MPEQTDGRDLAADLALCDGASTGPWHYLAASVFDAAGGALAHVYQGDPDLEDVREQAQRDGRFLAAAREGWPAAVRLAQTALAERDELRRLLEAARAEADRLRGMVKGLCARAAAQSGLLSRRAEKAPATSGPAGMSVTEDDGDPA